MPIKKIIHHSKKIIKKVKKTVDAFSNPQKEAEKDTSVLLPKEETKKMIVEISLWSATKVILLVLGFLVLQNVLAQLIDTFMIFFFALFLATAFNPGVDKLEKFKIPRSIGIVILYILVIGILGIIIGGVVPILIEQVAEIANNLKDYLNDLIKNAPKDSLLAEIKPQVQESINKIQEFIDKIDKENIIESLRNYEEYLPAVKKFGNFASDAFGFLISIVNGIFNLILILLLTFFMVTEKDSLNIFFTSLFPNKYKRYISEKTNKIQRKIGEWVHGQVALFFIVGLIAFFGLKILGIKYALTLAMVAGLAEFLPYVGPILAFATAAPVAFNQSIFLGLWVIGFYAFLQILEGNVIVPVVMRKAVGLPPMVTIISMLIGWQFLGILGVILSVPLASIGSIFISDFTERKK